MKKNILILLMLVPVLGFISGCKKSSFDSKYNDPEKSTSGTIDGFYTGLFNNRRIIPEYWHLWTFASSQMGIYTQTVGWVSDLKMYEQGVSFAQDRWDDFYAAPGGGRNYTAPVSSYREIQRLYDELETDADKAGYLLFMETARIFVYDQATQQVDLWGDVPFSKAGALNAEGILKLPEYDIAKTVYDSALFHVKRISNYLATVQPQQFYLNKLAKQDILYKGDLLKWRRYANSLLLRLAMRISYTDENTARTLVTEILSNPTLYPLIDANENNAEIVTGGTNMVVDLVAAFNEGHDLAPGYMVDSLLEPSGDPRLRLLYTRNKNGVYEGVATSWTSTQQTNAIGANLISRLDSVTFVNNKAFPGIIFTAAEVSFLKAEAFQRWGGIGGGTAKNAYETGIQQSIANFFKIHNLNPLGVHETAPTQQEYVLLLANPKVAYGVDAEDNLNKIGLQKWVNFHIMQNTQAWAEIRRSGYPKLNFPIDAGSSVAPSPANRLLYPPSERTLNTENYSKVEPLDKPYNKIFWMR